MRGIRAACVLLLTGCGRAPSPPPPLLFIGVDGADWELVDARIAAGTMPRVADLVHRGARADLQSFVPLQKSPVIWTSMATGKVPSKHGVGGFTAKGAPARAGERTGAAWWDVLGSRGRRQAVVGWWVTYPAAPIDGVMVSDYLQYAPGRTHRLDGAVSPPEVWPEVEGLVVDPEHIPLEELGRFVDLDIARAHGDDAERLLRDLRWIYAADQTYRTVATALLERERFDTFTVYLRGLDAVCHAYWRYYRPQGVALLMDPWAVDMLDEVVLRYHDYVDEVVGDIVAAAGPGARVVLASDHGFAGHRDRHDPAFGVAMHRDRGVLVAAGTGIRQGVVLPSAHVLDVAPTVLALSGVPPARDMDGQVLLGAFDPETSEAARRLIAEPVDSWDATQVRATHVGPSRSEDEEAIRRLRSLGYVE